MSHSKVTKLQLSVVIFSSPPPTLALCFLAISSIVGQCLLIISVVSLLPMLVSDVLCQGSTVCLCVCLCVCLYVCLSVRISLCVFSVDRCPKSTLLGCAALQRSDDDDDDDVNYYVTVIYHQRQQATTSSLNDVTAASSPRPAGVFYQSHL